VPGRATIHSTSRSGDTVIEGHVTAKRLAVSIFQVKANEGSSQFDSVQVDLNVGAGLAGLCAAYELSDVILAVPPSVWRCIGFGDPKLRKKLRAAPALGHNVKGLLKFDRRFWKDLIFQAKKPTARRSPE
jgi:hypothetical protein